MQDDFRPPDHYSPLGKFAFRASGMLAVFITLTVLAYFLLPVIYTYVSLPLGDWAYEIVRSWTGDPYEPRKY